MVFAPHKIEKRKLKEVERDENGDVIVSSSNEECDDVNNKTFYNADGSAYHPLFKVVCPLNICVEKGDTIRATCSGVVRGKGVVDKVIHCNYLQYQTIWLM